LAQLALDWKFEFIDCQVTNPHLLSLGAEEIPRDEFLDKLALVTEKPTLQKKWKFEFK
jgi:leucyl/phenylalanyl-tRNA--protein transferase